MKILIPILIGLLVVGCSNQEQTDTNESTPTTNTNEVSGTTEKPVKELTLEEKVVGTYEAKEDEDGYTYKFVFLENGVFELYENGKKLGERKWSIADGEIHVKYDSGYIEVYRYNKDKSITHIAAISVDGQREDVPKEHQSTFKKIK